MPLKYKEGVCEMKNKWFAGIGVLLVFGFVLAGCQTNPETSPQPETTPQPKSLTITGMPAGYSANLIVEEEVEPYTRVAIGAANLGEQDVTFNLVLGEDPWNNDAAPWTGSGEYIVQIIIWQTSDDGSPKRYYYDSTVNPKLIFTDETPSQTVAFDLFKEPWW
jgi:hypothetical protein